MIVSYVIIVLVAIVLAYAIGMYNALVRLRQRVREAWSDIDVQLKRRYDLIPNLVETVKGYAKHESQVFENVTKARAAALSGGGTAHERAEKENMLTGALKSIFAVAEAYPELKANTNFIELQYNGNVMDINTRIEQFPSNVIANLFSFAKEEFFDLDEVPAQREPVKVSF
ncbi:MAG: LemA family protein [Parcubacteria group bacterium GW2011_GWA1_47_9]|nr:MAG: LemA family protein [Parcubacteria group bacterium GW2011_GWA1_47_9]